ncbi:MAG TPA: SET domain-containing protein-lysine N-methyltransferase [Methylomirabilota bacterium]|nr:SET domain-containing protein-lysine N-methyltransferase [Methylomirabilota bacterium]
MSSPSQAAGAAAAHGPAAPPAAAVRWLEFKPSPIQGWGGFARCDIPAGTHIIEYVGERISKEESRRRCEAGNPFIFTVTEEYDLDGSGEENPARLLNHSCTPNAEALNIDDHIWIVALRDIRAGEEVTFDYGFDLEDYRENPCSCGAPNCLGYIVAAEFAPGLRQRARDLQA